MRFFLYALFAGAVVGLDQGVKALIVANFSLHETAPLIPGILRLTYVRNTGAAFSFFQGQQWLFFLIFLVFTGLIFWEYFKKPLAFTGFERWCIAAIYGGGLGNMIDRLRLGYVVDMFETVFMDFPVFNVADCFITCGCAALMLHLAFCNKAFWKDEKSCA